MDVVESICPEEKRVIFKCQSFCKNYYRRIEEMSENLKSRQENCFQKLQFFLIAIDESTDTTDTAQLAVFVRGIKENFYVFEEFVELILLIKKPLASYWSPTALKRPDRSKQCQCLQFAKCIPGLLHYYTCKTL